LKVTATPHFNFISHQSVITTWRTSKYVYGGIDNSAIYLKAVK